MSLLVDVAVQEAQEFREPDRAGSCLSISKRGFHRIAYVEYGAIDAVRTVLCVHGLTRQGRDFDRLAAGLARLGYRVVCPDLAGRGRSERLADPEEYTLPQYATDMAVLLAHLRLEQVDWIGTSLGGLTGIVMAGQAKTPVRRLILNDIGPYLPWSALSRIANNVYSSPESFASLEEATAQFRVRLAPFGRLAHAEWEHLARHSLELRRDGRWHVLCDPKITAAFQTSFLFNLSLWSYWDAISCPALVLRGESSDLLLARTTEEMTRRGPHADVLEFRDCGHAPALLEAGQIAAVLGWMGMAEAAGQS